jgi:maleate isomerase
MTGFTARIGLVLPSVNTVVEPWYASVLPDGFSLHVTRLLLPEKLTPQAVRQMDAQDGARALRQIASVRPHSAIYACFASSVVLGVTEDRRLAQMSGDVAGCPAETAAGASFAAMRTMGMRRIGVISPYAEEIDAAEHRLLCDAGFEIAAACSFGITNSFELACIAPDEMVKAGQDMAGRVDGIFISCMNTLSHLAIAPLERDLGVPVVTATSATLWAALCLAGGPDRLLPDLGGLALQRL